MRLCLILCAVLLRAQTADYQLLERAYQALNAKAYEEAVVNFESALALNPNRAAVHKDAAYVALKIGRNRSAREHFRQAMLLDPKDSHAALEYAFLSFEASENRIEAKAEARRVFDRIRKQTADREAAATAQTAFQNIDGPLQSGIARWSAALAASAPTFSVHYELAQLAEQRDLCQLAADHYLAAWHLESQRRTVLVDIGRMETALQHPERATAALLAASRGGEPRAADHARELLPNRYPYVYEFRNALELDPANTELHRELAYLLLRMEKHTEAEAEFAHIVKTDAADLLSAAQLGLLLLARGERSQAMPLFTRVLQGNDAALANRIRTALHLPHQLAAPETPAELDARVMYERSLRAGYMKDALRYLTIAQEANPTDYELMLKLGWMYNQLHDDRTALGWFQRARASEDPEQAAEAKKAFGNLRPEFARLRTTFWSLPFYSSRWHDEFLYGQMKTEIRVDQLPIRPYVSVRFIGDINVKTPGPNPQLLSESAFIVAFGAVTKFHGVTAWGEAGSAVSYRKLQAVPDYRGGLSWGRGWGHGIGNEARGMFAETNADEVYVSRFGKDWLTYSQWRGGWTQHNIQFLWNANVTIDSKRQYWANFVETGPGIRLRLPGAPPGLLFSVNGYRGVYLRNEGNPRRPNFFDFRAGFWYAFTH